METIIEKFQSLYTAGQKISVVTCYDYSFSRILAQTNIDALLVGDSLGMVVQGHKDTIPVTLDEMIYHAKAVKRGAPNKHVIVDMPFMSYQVSFQEGIANACRIFKETQADAVKLEGADSQTLDQIQRLTEIGIPVVGHVGLTPQSYQVLGGYKVQRDIQSIAIQTCKLVEKGAFAVVLEMTPEEITEEIKIQASRLGGSRAIITIGIGAGRYTSGQVLVLNDLLGMNSEFSPKFLKKYSNLEEIIKSAVNSYDQDVKEKKFPSQEHVFILNKK